MPWTTPETFTAGQTLTAASMTKIADNTAFLKSLVNVNQTVVTAATANYNSETFADITGMSVSITPTFSTSKVLVIVQVNVGISAANNVAIKLLRGAVEVGNGVAASNRPGVLSRDYVTNNGSNVLLSGVYLDSPATTSATTYKLQWGVGSGSTVYLNRTGADSDAWAHSRNVSSIYVQEIPVP